MYWSCYNVPSGKPATVAKKEEEEEDDDDVLEIEVLFFSVSKTVEVLAILKRINKLYVIYSIKY